MSIALPEPYNFEVFHLWNAESEVAKVIYSVDHLARTSRHWRSDPSYKYHRYNLQMWLHILEEIKNHGNYPIQEEKSLVHMISCINQILHDKNN